MGSSVVCVLAAVALCGCSAGDDAGESSSAPPPSAEAPPTTERPTGPEIAEAIHVDSGLTNGPVLGCNTAGGQATGWYPTSCPPEQQEPIQDSALYGSLSYGVVLENTSEQVVSLVPVTIRFLDGDGEVIREHPTPFSDSDLTGIRTTVAILRPGERVGFGGMTYPGRPDAAEVQVEVGVPGDWEPPAAMAARLGAETDQGELTVTGITVQEGDHGEPVTTYTVASSYETEVRPSDAYVVFRDAEGRIIGGADELFDLERIPAGGTAEHVIALDDPLAVPGIDEARTEVYIPGVQVRQR